MSNETTNNPSSYLLVSIEEKLTNYFYDRTEQLRSLHTLMADYSRFAFQTDPAFEPNAPLRLYNHFHYVGRIVPSLEAGYQCLKCQTTVHEWEASAERDMYPLVLTYSVSDPSVLFFHNTPMTDRITIGRMQQIVFEALKNIETFTINTHFIRNTLTEKGGEAVFTYDLFNRQSFCISMEFTAKAIPLRSTLPIFDYGRI